MSLFSSKKPGTFRLQDNKRTAFFILLFAFGLLSTVVLYPSTMMSFKEVVILSLLFLSVDILVLKLKTKLKELPAFIALSISILLAQIAVLLWLNSVTLGRHVEKYKVVGTQHFDYGILLQLENNAYSDFFSVRFMPSKASLHHRDTVVYHFSDGLLGFKIIDEVE
jgi:hypothetical protein